MESRGSFAIQSYKIFKIKIIHVFSLSNTEMTTAA